MTHYRNIELIDIPSGMGGTFPAAIAKDGDEVQVICLHPEFFTNWLFTVNKTDCKPMSYRLTDSMKKIIDSIKAA